MTQSTINNLQLAALKYEGNYYKRISEEFFKKEWSDYQGDWDFRELLRYLSDRRIDIHINKGSLWIHLQEGERIEILLYWSMNSSEQSETCKDLYELFSTGKDSEKNTVASIKSMITNAK